MNSMSWFIYFSDVIGNLQPLLAIGGILAMVVAAICVLAWVMEDFEPGPRYAKRIGFVAIPVILIACLIPSKTTMYAIAASQLGEAVITSSEGKQMIDDTKQILREYLKTLKKDAGKS